MNNYNDQITIENNLIEYELNKDKYFFNYLIDDDINQFIASFEDYYKNTQNPEEFSYTEWQNIETNKIVGKCLQKEDIVSLSFKLLFTTLMMYDKNYRGSSLSYKFQQRGSIYFVIVFGAKKWKENKITFGSCPFQNIRIISLNKCESDIMQKACALLHKETLFNGKELKATCALFTQDVDLSIEATKELNFKNLGIKVESKKLITSSRIKAIMKQVQEAKSAVLIFPELLVDDTLDQLIDAYAAKVDSLKLIVKGSRHVAKSGHYTNTAYCSVKAGDTWNKVMFSYNKRIPFTMGYTTAVAKAYKIDTAKYPLDKSELLVEDILVDDRITILPYKDCIVGIAICRDVLDLLDKHNPLHRYCDFVDLMLVISENNGDTNMFVGTAECLARWHNCATLYTNALHEAGAQKLDPYLEMSFALYPYKNTTNKNYDNRSSTSVSGVITYATNGGYRIDEENDRLVTILNSKGIKYEQLTAEEKANGCKVYTFKTE